MHKVKKLDWEILTKISKAQILVLIGRLNFHSVYND